MIPTKPINAIWSDEQWLAIYASGQNILVNAGAGSGKTAVLTERIIRILKEPVSLSKLIVLTFTKAAASEMKERLRNKLIKEIKNGDNNLIADLEYLDQSSIQTFDSFALSLVKKYHYLLGVDRSINIGDSVIFETERVKIIDEIFDNLYEEENKSFHNLINLLCIKNDDKVKDFLLKIDKQLDLVSDREEYLNTYLDKFYQKDVIFKNIDEYLSLIQLDIDKIKQRINRLKKKITDSILVEHIYDCEEALGSLFSAKRYEDYLKVLEISLPAIPRKVDNEDEKSQVKFEKDEIKKVITKINDYLSYQSTSEMYDEIIKTKEYAAIIVDILKKTHERMNDFKKLHQLYDFYDIAKMAIKLVKDNEELRGFIKDNTYEILIDEYQDTSDLQETLISYLENNNVYMVGDMKQSIYRFRNANPNIFKSKYQSFLDKNFGLAIDLSKNYRSREEVLDNINLIFSQTMSMDLGGVDYNENHRLQFGNREYQKNKLNDSYDMEVLYYDYEDYQLNQHEIEAFIVGNDIKKKVADGYLIYDKDQQIVRKANYNDFTILAPQKSQFDLYKKIFEYLQIPLVIHKDQEFVRSTEIYAIKNIIRCVYSLYNYEYYQSNFKDALLSVLRSFVVELDDITISKIFSDDLLQGLKFFCNDVYLKLSNISKLVQNSTSSQILSEIYQSFHIYENIVKLGNIEIIEDKLNFLLLKFKELDEMGYCLKDIINYLDLILEAKLDIEYSGSKISKENVVNMMSVHKSKGLEFPICYFPELDVKFNFQDIYDKVLFDQTYGIILPIFDDGLKDTFLKALYIKKYKTEEISERLRVLYVALTRAKEKMIIVIPKYEEYYKEDLELVPLVDRLNYKKLYDVFSSIQYSLQKFSRLIVPTNLTKDYQIVGNLKTLKSDCKKTIHYFEVKLKGQEKVHQTASSSYTGLISREAVLKMDLGTKIHHYFESIDYTKDLFEQLKLLNCEQFIKDKLNRFFQNKFIFKKDIIKAYHEHQFRYEIDNNITAGIIDLILETDDELMIIDYKLADITKKEYEKQLSIYKDYLKTVSTKKISAYLYSIINESLKEI